MRTILRRIFGVQDPPPESNSTDSYFEKLIKYIPADIVAAYVTIAVFCPSIITIRCGSPGRSLVAYWH